MQTVSVRMCVNKLATSRDIEYLKLRRLLSDLENIVNKKKMLIFFQKKNKKIKSSIYKLEEKSIT